MGVSGGMTRMKGTSPKVSNKDQNRPRQLKQYGANTASLGGIGASAQGNNLLHNSGYVIRNIQSSKGMNRH